ELPSKLDDKQKDTLKGIVERNIEKEKFTVVMENLGEEDLPVIITRPEYMRRMKDMSALGGSGFGFGDLPDQMNLVINVNNPVMTKILDEGQKDMQDQFVKQLYDLALLSQNLLKGKSLSEFINRSIKIIE
ncbi:MAG: molecular chaperone HtpG, partial [Bacteroidota bacterium]|nr:molecular chaperone HtpG [Bacteroidota bacterium]